MSSLSELEASKLKLIRQHLVVFADKRAAVLIAEMVLKILLPAREPQVMREFIKLFIAGTATLDLNLMTN